MTVLDNTPRDQYTATGGQVAFTYTFEIAAEGDIAVLQNGTLLNLGAGAGEYAVTGAGVDTGGVVTLVTGATAGDIITLYRDMALDRLTSYTNGGDFLAADVNNDFDRLWLALQQNTGVSDRALVAPNTDPTDINMTIPTKTDRLGKLLQFNATTGNPEVVSPTSIVGSGAFNVYNFTGDGTTVAFTLGTAPGVENNTQVYIDGVYQQKNTYTVSDTTLTFSAAPPNLSTIEVMVVTAQPINTANAASVSFTQAGSTDTRTVQAKLEESVSVMDFGAIGDGIADDTVAIQAALNSGAKKIFVPSGEYIVSAELSVPNYVTVYGEGESSYINGNAITAGTGADQKSVFKLGAAINSAYSSNPVLGTDVSPGTAELTVDQTTDVTVGDIISLANNLVYDETTPNIEGDPAEQVEFFTVIAKTSTTITLDRPATFAYLTSTPATIENYVRNEQICLEDMKITSNNDFVLGFEASQMHKGRLKSLTIDTNNKSRAIEFRRSIDCEINGCITENTGNSTAIWFAYFSTSSRIINNTINLHDLTMIGDTAILVYFGANRNLVANNTIRSYRGYTPPLPAIAQPIWGIVVHTKSYGNTVIGNTVTGSYFGMGTIFGSFGNTFTGNAITSCLVGMRTEDSRNIIMSGNSIVSCGNGSDNTSAGILIHGCFDCSYTDNNIMDGLYYGINVYEVACKRLNISGNSITNSAQTAIRVIVDCQNSIFSNNNCYDPNGDGIYFGSDVSQSVVSNNQVINASNDGIQFYLGSTKIRCNGNTVQNCDGDGITLGTGGVTSESYFQQNVCVSNTGYGINLLNGPVNCVVDNILYGNTAGRTNNAYTSTPSGTTTADTNFMVYNEPADPTLAKTVLGWRRKDATTTGTAGWRVVNVSET